MTIRHWGLLILLALLWGGAFFFVKISVMELPVLVIVFCRVALAALALVAYVLISGRALPKALSIWIAFLVMGFLNNVVPFSLIVWGQQSLSSGLAAILNGTTPIFTMLIAGFLLVDEKLTLNKSVGAVIGLLGVVMISGPEALMQSSGTLWAQLAILGAAFSYGCAAVYARRFRAMGVEPVIGAMGQLCASSLMLLSVMLIFTPDDGFVMPSLGVGVSLICLAIFCTAWAYILYFRLLHEAGATNASLVTLLIPLFALLLGGLFLGEGLMLTHGIGMGLISAGLLCVDGRLFKLKPRLRTH
ncbi:MAG: DMT family transporter [Cohaesibacter sp.]|nr:DMT family transporter [Cohaesibacter sp.]